jgi:hypothetical protein
MPLTSRTPRYSEGIDAQGRVCLGGHVHRISAQKLLERSRRRQGNLPKDGGARIEIAPIVSVPKDSRTRRRDQMVSARGCQDRRDAKHLRRRTRKDCPSDVESGAAINEQLEDASVIVVRNGRIVLVGELIETRTVATDAKFIPDTPAVSNTSVDPGFGRHRPFDVLNGMVTAELRWIDVEPIDDAPADISQWDIGLPLDGESDGQPDDAGDVVDFVKSNGTICGDLVAA